MSAPRPAAPVPRPRATRQRTAVSRLLDDTEGFQSAQEIHEKLRHGGEGIGLTTVYRTLQTLAEAGEIDVLHTPGGEALYRRCSAHHHHHLVCRHCGRTVEVEGPAVELWAEQVADAHGFTDIDHTVEISGRCAECTLSPDHSERPDQSERPVPTITRRATRRVPGKPPTPPA